MQKTSHNKPCALIITGPTASGKTALSEQILNFMPGEIINADLGQFYTPLSVGTAKPDLSSIHYVTHGFNILDEPRYLSVVAYRDLVTKLVDQVWSTDKTPIIVGGSLFYIKSLFFPPHDLIEQEENIKERVINQASGELLWQQLHAIDPVRAQELHPNDEYRIRRALAIWQKTGVKPSVYKPVLQIPFRAMIVFVCPDRAKLNATIQRRVESMLQNGWVVEVEKLVGTPWEDFLRAKGLIGYAELIDWVKRGKPLVEFGDVVTTISRKTQAYAKRQVTFWKSFSQQLDNFASDLKGDVRVEVVTEVTPTAVAQVSERLSKFLDRK